MIRARINNGSDRSQARTIMVATKAMLGSIIAATEAGQGFRIVAT